jgi:rubredoxin
MPWTCPVCTLRLQHTTEIPQTGQVYRCPICKLNLVFDPVKGKMRPVPPPTDGNKKTKAA